MASRAYSTGVTVTVCVMGCTMCFVRDAQQLTDGRDGSDTPAQAAGGSESIDTGLPLMRSSLSAA